MRGDAEQQGGEGASMRVNVRITDMEQRETLRELKRLDNSSHRAVLRKLLAKYGPREIAFMRGDEAVNGGSHDG